MRLTDFYTTEIIICSSDFCILKSTNPPKNFVCKHPFEIRVSLLNKKKTISLFCVIQHLKLITVNLAYKSVSDPYTPYCMTLQTVWVITNIWAPNLSDLFPLRIYERVKSFFTEAFHFLISGLLLPKLKLIQTKLFTHAISSSNSTQTAESDPFSHTIIAVNGIWDRHVHVQWLINLVFTFTFLCTENTAIPWRNSIEAVHTYAKLRGYILIMNPTVNIDFGVEGSSKPYGCSYYYAHVLTTSSSSKVTRSCYTSIITLHISIS